VDLDTGNWPTQATYLLLLHTLVDARDRQWTGTQETGLFKVKYLLLFNTLVAARDRQWTWIQETGLLKLHTSSCSVSL
jgi:hypothetical protein